MIDASIESMGGGRPKASTDTDQRVMTKGTGPLPPWPTRGDYSPDRRSLPLTKPSTLSRGTRPGRKTASFALKLFRGWMEKLPETALGFHQGLLGGHIAGNAEDHKF